MATIYRVQILPEGYESPVWVNLNSCKTVDDFTAPLGMYDKVLDWEGFPNGTVHQYMNKREIWDTYKLYSLVESEGNEAPFRTFCLLFSENYEAFKRAYRGTCSDLGCTPSDCMDMDGFAYALSAYQDTDIDTDYDLDYDPDYDHDDNLDYSYHFTLD